MNAFVQQQGSTPRAADLGIQALQDREAVLLREVAKMRAQQGVLQQQAQSGEAVIRTAAETQLRQMDLDLASSEADLDVVQKQIAAHLRTTAGPNARIVAGPNSPVIATPYTPPPPLLDRIDNDAITAMFVITTMALLIPLSVGLMRRMWRRPPVQQSSPQLDALSQRFDRVEQAVDAIAIEIERISEGQRFVTKVMSERPAVVQQPATPAADEASMLGEAKPFLALGAGPIEPIPVVQRQAVRQSITPH